MNFLFWTCLNVWKVWMLSCWRIKSVIDFLHSIFFFLRENNLFLKDDARRGKTIFFWFLKQKLVRLKLNGFEKQKSEWIDIWLKYDQNYSTADRVKYQLLFHILLYINKSNFSWHLSWNYFMYQIKWQGKRKCTQKM